MLLDNRLPVELGQWQAWLMQAPAAVGFMRAPEWTFLLVNERYREIVQRDPVGQTLREAFPELAGQGVYELFDRVLETREPYVGNEVPVSLYRRGRLEEGYFNFIYQPIFAADGRVEGIFLLGVEVTEHVQSRRRLEAEVAERLRAERLLAGERTVLESIARGRPLATTLETLTSVIEGQLEGASCSILVLEQGEDGVARLRHGAAPGLPDEYNTGIDGVVIGPAVGSCGTAAYTGERVVVTDIASDPLWGDIRDLALSHGLRACWSTPIRGSGGEVLGTFALYRREPSVPTEAERDLVDVLTYLAGVAIERNTRERERSELLAREQQARVEAEMAVRVRDEFLSIASHELRTPVTVVKGVAQLLQRSLGRERLDVQKVTRQVDTIRRASERLSVLINDLLDVSRLQSGRLDLRREWMDLTGMLRDVGERHGEQLETGHRVRLQMPEGCVMVNADATRLEQILDNLLTNAVKYSPPGSAIDVVLETSADGEMVSVRDRGIGLPTGAEERIFEPFGRAENAVKGNVPGLGLGLYVSRRLAELHGGTLWAESAGENQGTTMRLWLPSKGRVHEAPMVPSSDQRNQGTTVRG